MRWISAFSVLMIAWLGSAQQNDGEKLFRSMEKMVRDAKGVKMAFDIEAVKDKDTDKMRGAVTVAEGNRARLEVTGSLDGKQKSITIIADGKQAYSTASDAPKPETKPIEQNLSQTRPQILARGGVFATFQIGPATEKFDIDKMMPVSDFKLGKKEKVGTRDAQPVECTMKLDNGQMVQMTVWLDSQSNLPLKRVVVAPADKGVFRVTEVYTEITLNPKVDGKMFEAPK
jgi:outer membrane lipoprotein-sorting protein